MSVSEILIEMRSDFRANVHSPDDLPAMMKKYDAVFFSEKNYGTLMSEDLVHIAKTMYDLDISHEKLCSELPGICTALGMDLIPFNEISSSNSSGDHYQICLFGER